MSAQSINDTNLFVYCQNNPICMTDHNGEAAFGALDIVDYFIIHRMVQIKCVVENGWKMEVYVKGSLGRGFLDLYDTSNNSYYEVKSARFYYMFPSIVQEQMARYEAATIKSNGLSHPTPGTKYVTGKIFYGFYDIEYTLIKPGLITYTVKPNYWRVLATVVAILATTAAPYAAPALAYGIYQQLVG